MTTATKTNDWDALDHDVLNDAIRDRVLTESEYSVACRLAGGLFQTGDTEATLARRAAQAAAVAAEDNVPSDDYDEHAYNSDYPID